MVYGMGPRASPLVCGYTEHHRELERALAELKGTGVRLKLVNCKTNIYAQIAMSFEKSILKSGKARPEQSMFDLWRTLPK